MIQLALQVSILLALQVSSPFSVTEIEIEAPYAERYPVIAMAVQSDAVVFAMGEMVYRCDGNRADLAKELCDGRRAIRCLAISENGATAVGTEKGFVVRLPDGTSHAFDESHGASGVRWLVSPRSGEFWAGVNRQNLRYLDGRCEPWDCERVWNSKGEFVIGTTHGISIFSDGKWHSHKIRPKELSGCSFVVPSDRVVWRGTSQGIDRFDSPGWSPRIDLGAFTSDAVLDGKALWVATSNGLYRINDDQVTHFGEEHGIPAKLHSLLKDAKGDLWIGHETGVCVMRKRD